MAEAGTHMAGVFETLCATAGEKVQDFNLQDIADTPWAMARTGTHMPEVFLQAMVKTSGVLTEVFDSLCRAAAAKVQAFNAQDLVNTLWAMGRAGRMRGVERYWQCE